jgi:hypothetical protein
VPAEAGLDRAADFPGLHREQGILEGLSRGFHLRHPAQVATTRLEPVSSELARAKRGEIRAGLSACSASCVALLGGLLRGGSLGIDLDQDVRGKRCSASTKRFFSCS